MSDSVAYFPGDTISLSLGKLDRANAVEMALETPELWTQVALANDGSAIRGGFSPTLSPQIDDDVIIRVYRTAVDVAFAEILYINDRPAPPGLSCRLTAVEHGSTTATGIDLWLIGDILRARVTFCSARGISVTANGQGLGMLQRTGKAQRIAE